jgi:putative ABC transport system permease protein
MAVAELGVPIIAGGIAGMALGRLLLGTYAPPGAVGVRAQPGAVGIGSAILLASLALLATVVALRTHREFERIRGATAGRGWRILSAVPWELLTSGLAVLGWSRPATGAGSSRTLNPLPQVDPLALTYPVFVVLTVGLLVARIAWLLLHVSHHARFWSRPALQLAIRRLAGARGPVTGVLVIGVLAIGTLAPAAGSRPGRRRRWPPSRGSSSARTPGWTPKGPSAPVPGHCRPRCGTTARSSAS